MQHCIEPHILPPFSRLRAVAAAAAIVFLEVVARGNTARLELLARGDNVQHGAEVDGVDGVAPAQVGQDALFDLRFPGNVKKSEHKKKIKKRTLHIIERAFRCPKLTSELVDPWI